jgi:hypothetical protein
MKKSMALTLIATAILSGCSTTKPVETPISSPTKPVETPISSPTPPVKEVQTLAAPGKIEAPLTIDVPPWYVKAPASTDEYMFVTGTGLSSELSMSRAKALLDAQHQLASKLNGVLDAATRQQRKDTSGTVNSDYTSITIRKNIIETAITGHHLEDSKIQAENRGYRTFVLVRYPVGDANKLLRQQEQRDSKKQDEDAKIDKELGNSQSKVFSVVAPEVKPVAATVVETRPVAATVVETRPVAATVVETRPVPISELKLLEVDNEEYKKRRAEALQKPGAVVGNMTLR